MDIKENWLLLFTYFFDKMSKRSSINTEVKPNEQLAEELHKPTVRNFKERKLYSGFKENI